MRTIPSAISLYYCTFSIPKIKNFFKSSVLEKSEVTFPSSMEELYFVEFQSEDQSQKDFECDVCARHRTLCHEDYIGECTLQ